MEKYISFTVPSDSAISTVGQVLRAQGHLTKKQISRAKFLPDGIQKNGIRCRITESVLPGDEIQVCLETAETASEQLVSGDFSSLEILYEDQDILAVNKPAGMLTHPSGAHYADTLSNQVAAYFKIGSQMICRTAKRPPSVSAQSDGLTRRPLVLFCLPRIRLRRSDFRHSVKSIFFARNILPLWLDICQKILLISGIPFLFL